MLSPAIFILIFFCFCRRQSVGADGHGFRQGAAAVDYNLRTGQIAGLVASQESEQFADFDRFRQTFHRYANSDIGNCCLRIVRVGLHCHFLYHRSTGVSQLAAVDTDQQQGTWSNQPKRLWSLRKQPHPHLQRCRRLRKKR